MIDKTKAEELRETPANQIDWPNYAILAHAVCALDETGCGWSGFLLEGAFRKDGAVHNLGRATWLFRQSRTRYARTAARPLIEPGPAPSTGQTSRVGSLPAAR